VALAWARAVVAAELAGSRADAVVQLLAPCRAVAVAPARLVDAASREEVAAPVTRALPERAPWPADAAGLVPSSAGVLHRTWLNWVKPYARDVRRTAPKSGSYIGCPMASSVCNNRR
jgi:hypothetical protein